MRDAFRGRRQAEREASPGGRIGEILVKRGRLSEEQLRAALEAKSNDPRRMGEILLSLGFVSEEDLARAVAEAAGLEYVALTEDLVDPTAIPLLSEKALRKYAALPLRVEGGRLVLAMSDPTNVLALDDLKTLAGHPLRPVVALKEDIKKLQDRMFGINEEISEFMETSGDGSSRRGNEGSTLSVSRVDEGRPVIRLVNSIIRRALDEGASDIHIEPRTKELVIRYRVDGVLKRGMSAPLRLKDSVISRFKIMGDLDISEKRIPQDGRFTVETGDVGRPVDVRVASLPSVRGEKVVLRLLTHEMAMMGLEELGLPQEALRFYRSVFNRPYGAVVVTGPTGSGKSTTLYTTLGELNNVERNIVTVEDPVEYRIEGITQIQIHPAAGLTFASGLKHILRGDPDVVMVGEIRDRETAELFVEAALTGHMVLVTLHTNDAAGALPRLTNMGIDPFLTTSAIGCVVAQRLARRLCEECKEPVRVSEAVLRNVGFPFDLWQDKEMAFHKPAGCEKCRGSGYSGRIGVYELMAVTEEVETLALSRSSADEIGRAATRAGMVRMRADGLTKAARGLTSIEEILRTTV